MTGEMAGKEAIAVGSQGAGYEQEGPGAAIWRHTGLGSEGGNGEEDGGLAAEVVGAGRATTPQSQTQGVEEATGRQHEAAKAGC